MYKRLYYIYLFLDGQTVPQLITDHGPLHCLCVTNHQFVSYRKVFVIHFFY